MPLLRLGLLPIIWLCTFALWLKQDPLAMGIRMGSDLAKEHLLQAMPPEWMGGLALPVIQLVDRYVGPYAAAGEVIMSSWALLFTIIIPAVALILGGLIVHGVLVIGGVPEGWKGTARVFIGNRFAADLAVVAWIGLLLLLKLPLVVGCLLLAVGVMLIRLGTLIHLLVALAKAQQLGPLRIIFLGLPALLVSLLLAALLALAPILWFSLGFALRTLK